MDTIGSSEGNHLDVELIRRIDAICRRYEAEWNEGLDPRIDDYLAEAASELRAVLRGELELLETELLVRDAARKWATGKLTAYPVSQPEPATLRDALTIAPIAVSERASTETTRIEQAGEPTEIRLTDAITVHSGAEKTAGAGSGERGLIRYFGDYEIIREVARGGMGVVFQARQVSLNRIVAIKMILAGQLANENDVKRFYTEAEAAANLDHPWIVPIFEVGRHQDQHYFSMAYVEGESLAQRLSAGPLEPREAAGLMRRVCEAIDYAHCRDVIHRDLKPANILVDASGNPRVTDFGLAKRMTGDIGLTGSGQMMGTPSYMPPEQAGGNRGDVGPAADVYGLGATLYALVTGRPPFQAATPMDTALQVLSVDPVPPRRLNAAIGADLETICLKCLEKEPARRYGSARALGEDLRRYLDGDPILARPVSLTEKAWKWAKRRPAIALLGAAVVVATTLGIVGVIWEWRRAEYNYHEAVIRRNEARRNYDEAEAQRQIAQDKTREVMEKAALLERQNYINLVALAQRENLANNVGYAERLLERCPAGMRGWEWRYVNRANHRELMSVGAVPRPEMTRAALSPDSTRIVCAGGNDLWIYELASGRQLYHLRGHDQNVRAVAWSPDGGTIASGARDNTIRLWSPETGKEVGILRGHGSWITGLAFSGDGRWLAASAGSHPGVPSNGAEVKLWDYKARREVRSFQGIRGIRALSVAFSPDSRTIAASESLWAARLWDVETGQKLRDFEGVHQMPVINVAFRPDGRMLATAGDDGTVGLWEIETGKSVRILRGHTGLVNGLAFSRDGRSLASGSWDSTIRLWDPENGRETGLLRGHLGAVDVLEFSRGGERLMSAGLDGVVKIWDPKLALDPPVLDDHRGWAFSAAFRPGQPMCATAGWGVIHLWDECTGRRIRSLNNPHPREVIGLAYGSDGKALISAGKDGVVKIWDADTDAQRLEIKAHTGELYAVACDRAMTILATAGSDGTVRLWDAKTGAARRVLNAHAKGVTSAVFSPDGSHIATIGFSDNAKVWDLMSGADPLVLDVAISARTRIGNAISFSPDGRVIAVPRADLRVALFDARDGRLIRDFVGHTDNVNVLAFSPDGHRLATASADRTIRFWDPGTGDEMFNLRGHQGGITSITWSVDGRRLITTSEDRTGRIWDAGPPTYEVVRDR